MQHDLFEAENPQLWQLDDYSRLTLYHDLFPQHVAQEFFEILSADIAWVQNDIVIAGQTKKIPRLNAWYGDSDAPYQYSGTRFTPLPWLPALLEIRKRVEEQAETTFNSVLANLYRDGNDSVAWHTDNEPELGRNPAIASVSFGQTRRFQIKHRTNKSIPRLDLDLPDNSLLLMGGEVQRHWIHCVPKTRKPCTPRINLTFRRVFHLL